jgi:hypothetical protein
MNSTTKYISVNEKQAEVLNDYLGLSVGDDNAFYDGCELLLEYEYSIEDTSFDHAFGTEKGFDIDIGDTYAVLDEERVDIDDLFDLTPEQINELSDHAVEEAEAGFNEPEEPDYDNED